LSTLLAHLDTFARVSRRFSSLDEVALALARARVPGGAHVSDGQRAQLVAWLAGPSAWLIKGREHAQVCVHSVRSSHNASTREL